MAKFKKGDRVRTKGYEGTHWDGEGVVTEEYDGFCILARINEREGGFAPHELAPAPLQLEAGKFYRTRDGRKVGPMRVYTATHWDVGVDDVFGGSLWRDDGSAILEDAGVDLIAEWVDEPQEDEPATFERVQRICVDHLGVDFEDVTNDASFIDDLGADSLDLVELVMAFEMEFGIEVLDVEAEALLTVGDAVKFIDRRTAKAPQATPPVTAEPKFKVGDRVRLINDTTMAARVGAEAVVTERGMVDGYVDVEWDRTNPARSTQMDGGYHPEHFELATPTSANTTDTTGFTVPLCAYEDAVTTTALGDAYVAGYKAGLAAHQAAALQAQAA